MGDLKLIRVEIEAFRRFQGPLDLSLLSPANEPLSYFVVAGPNGCGKTTLLEAILLALGKDELIVRDLEARERTISPRLVVGPDARLTVTLRAANGKEFVLRRTGGDIVIEYAGDDGRPATMPLAMVGPSIGVPRVEYISSRRLPAMVGAIQDEVRGRPPDGREANRLWRFKHRVRQQQGRRVPGYTGPEPLDQRWMATLNGFWQAFRTDQTTLRMDLVDPNNLDVSEWDLFLYDGERRVCPVDALSSGEQEVLSMAVPFITEPFDGLLLVDEPELHLHPQWQARVMRALRKVVPDAQVIIATHADDPWDDARSWERSLLVPRSDPRAARNAGNAP